ncbi:MAG: NADP-specific glutamate dehydrogenase, partial [Lachnospiraceae bacterium]|nr:NADP-specific glutamate dehydrogenase [Lachnospiraceae bacterium]
MFKTQYVKKVYDKVAATNSEQPEYLQAVREVLMTIEPLLEENPKLEEQGILERIVEPERQIMFRVAWVDD